jgi:hypothetical protein
MYLIEMIYETTSAIILFQGGCNGGIFKLGHEASVLCNRTVSPQLSKPRHFEKIP